MCVWGTDGHNNSSLSETDWQEIGGLRNIRIPRRVVLSNDNHHWPATTLDQKAHSPEKTTFSEPLKVQVKAVVFTQLFSLSQRFEVFGGTERRSPINRATHFLQ